MTLRHGVVVDGLLAEPGVGDPARRPRVTGVRLREAGEPEGGAVEDLHAPVVVAALGRRSAVPRWLGELGVSPVEQIEDTGLVYLSRFYRLRPEVDAPASDGPIGGDLGYLKYAVFQGDNRTLSVTFALDGGDRELRARLVDPEGFDRAATTLPATRVWADPSLTEAITPVHTMGGLINRRVSYLDDEGQPLVLGFHAVGDAHTCTNPLYGRGCSLAMVQAELLADALVELAGTGPDDLVTRAIAYEDASRREILPWYRAAVNQDRMNRQEAVERAAAEPSQHATPGPETPSTPDPDAERDARRMVQSIMRDGLMPAVRTDATVFRAFVRAFNLLDPPERIVTDPDVVGRVLAAYQSRDERPPEAPLGPDRPDLLDALAPS